LHRLWVGTGDGIDVVTDQGVDHLDERDGFAGNDSTATAFLMAPDGSLWLGATGGATHVLAQYYNGPPQPPSVVFLGARLGDRPIPDPHAAIEAPHDRNALSLEFASSSLLDARRLDYEVRLSPLETAWSATHQREVRYPSLLPGTYRLEARARIGAGHWGPTAALDFVILPAWWQTRWFLGSTALAGLLIVAAGVTWWLRRRTGQLHAQFDEGFRAVVDVMPDLISVHRGGKLIYLNRANCQFLGFDQAGERWRGIELTDRVHPDDRAQLAALFARVLALPPHIASEIVELRMRSADGGWRICEVSGLLVDIGGALTVVASGRDVTERKRLRAKLLVSDRMTSLGTLAAGIAHEINNPLSYVTGNLEAAAETLRDAAGAPGVAACAEPAEVTAAIKDARDGAERVRKIVQGLRMFSRAEEENRVPLALADVLEAAIRLTANEVRHRAQLVRELGPVPLVVADDSRLTQVFINLLVNAAHAIPEGHSDRNRITVRTRTDDHGHAVIEIEDTGNGIAPEQVSRVFDPFFTTKDVGGGTGLGLSICHGIISGLGGHISIESSRDSALVSGSPVTAAPAGHGSHGTGRVPLAWSLATGKVPRVGTVVRVELPPAELPAGPPLPPPPAPVDAPPATADARSPRVLLVDDEPLVADTMRRLLRRDYDITIALCGQDAIDQITRGARFDAIVSDVMMPNMTGIELLEQLQLLAPDQAQRLIFLSGGAFTAHTRERLDQLGVLQLEKPISAKLLRASVKRIVNEVRPPP
jgi:PAS domain S-box-containing protein